MRLMIWISYVQEINPHFTGGAHAAPWQLSELDAHRLTWPRAIGISDRSIQQVKIGQPEGDSMPSQFVITEASEVMAWGLPPEASAEASRT